MSDTEEPMDTESPKELELPAEPEAPVELVVGGIALKRVAEALVFASPKPITTKEIVAALNVRPIKKDKAA